MVVRSSRYFATSVLVGSPLSRGNFTEEDHPLEAESSRVASSAPKAG